MHRTTPESLPVSERQEILEAIIRMGRQFSEYESNSGLQTESLNAFITHLQAIADNPFKVKL